MVVTNLQYDLQTFRYLWFTFFVLDGTHGKRCGLRTQLLNVEHADLYFSPTFDI